MKKIAILAPNENKLNELKILFAESLSEIIFEVGSLADGIIKAKQLVENQPILLEMHARVLR